MSRQSDTQVDGAAGTITRSSSWPVQEPVAKQSIDFLVTRFGMTPLEVLAHELEPGVEQIKRRADRVGD